MVQLLFSDKQLTNRRCGDCTLCCKLVPVEKNLNKPAGVRCKYQTHRGCRVYANLEVVSPSCRFWNCQWLADPETRELRRPDRSHYVIDVMPDYVGHQTIATGEVQNVPVMQVWIDPDYPDAHRDPALRRYMVHVAETRQQATIVRYGNQRGRVIFPPSLASDGEWHEMESIARAEDSPWHNPLDGIHKLASRI
jgi:hypothetical protein